ncbi:hypothetical protein HJ588_06690 [Flexivirga sp. ID2601S]|uniref:Ricin B lectin domain-containing protein n=1 Tax=Flexivirga aerilata TaxID=1656889 RepID=A0A849AIA6_9MICO|nr:RICIN domain-containing protein [Flexivirga aerilata]NNG38958.1 hypothetical protein [Flexivirga aerilata]
MDLRHRLLIIGACSAGLALAAGTLPAAQAAPAPAPSYTVTTGTIGQYRYPTDTPAFPFIDSNGQFYFQQSAALYGANDPHEWEFYRGTDMDNAAKDVPLSTSADPANPQDRNDNTVWRCLNGPTGRIATRAPAPSRYALANYCDLVGTWVDPDTGNWVGLVHNEFTPQPFGDGLHYDAIDYAVSTDQGKTWQIKGQALSSPYSVNRDDLAAFPQQTYYYGDGDPRLFVDQKSGYFYVYYGSRIVDKGGSWGGFTEHVARASISAKMATGSWQKYYDGTWQQPGVGGKESNVVSVQTSPTGYTDPAKEYDPQNPGTWKQQQAAGTMPPNSDLFILNITWNAYLGKYIGTPERQVDDTPQKIYATDDLANPRWTLIGDTGPTYRTSSWYRWFIDPVSKTQGNTVGKTFRSYCSIACAGGSDGDFATITIDSSAPASAPVATDKPHQLISRSGGVLSQGKGTDQAVVSTGDRTARARWRFVPTGDGAYTVRNLQSGQLLGVDSGSTAGRAWGAPATLGTATASGPSAGQQWFLQPDDRGNLRLVNRYSGLALDLNGTAGAAARTQPYRNWVGTAGNPAAAAANPATQQLRLK